MLIKNTKINKEKIYIYLFLGLNFLVILGISILTIVLIIKNSNLFEDNKSEKISFLYLQQLYYLLIPLRITTFLLYLINRLFLKSNENQKIISKFITVFNNKNVYIFIASEIISRVLYYLFLLKDTSNYFIFYGNIVFIVYTIIITFYLFIKLCLIVKQSNIKTVKNLLIDFSLFILILIIFTIITALEQFEFSLNNIIFFTVLNIVLYFLEDYIKKRKDKQNQKISIRNVTFDIRELQKNYEINIDLYTVFEKDFYVKNVSLIAALNLDIRDYLKSEDISKENVENVINSKKLYFLKLNPLQKNSILKKNKIKLVIKKDNHLIKEYLENKPFLRKNCTDRQMLILILEYSFDKNFDIVNDKILLLDFINSNKNKHNYEVLHV